MIPNIIPGQKRSFPFNKSLQNKKASEPVPSQKDFENLHILPNSTIPSTLNSTILSALYSDTHQLIISKKVFTQILNFDGNFNPLNEKYTPDLKKIFDYKYTKFNFKFPNFLFSLRLANGNYLIFKVHEEVIRWNGYNGFKKHIKLDDVGVDDNNINDIENLSKTILAHPNRTNLKSSDDEMRSHISTDSLESSTPTYTYTDNDNDSKTEGDVTIEKESTEKDTCTHSISSSEADSSEYKSNNHTTNSDNNDNDHDEDNTQKTISKYLLSNKIERNSEKNSNKNFTPTNITIPQKITFLKNFTTWLYTGSYTTQIDDKILNFSKIFSKKFNFVNFSENLNQVNRDIKIKSQKFSDYKEKCDGDKFEKLDLNERLAYVLNMMGERERLAFIGRGYYT